MLSKSACSGAKLQPVHAQCWQLSKAWLQKPWVHKPVVGCRVQDSSLHKTWHFAPRGAHIAPSATLKKDDTSNNTPTLVGEDAAVFDLSSQSLVSWSIFSALLTGVLGLLYVVWMQPGVGLGDDYLATLESLTHGNPEATILLLLSVFAAFHSGLAGLRPHGERLIGARAYRVIFAVVSLPLATSALTYFVNHCHDGTQLWDVQGVPGVHQAVWVLNFIAFFFLYPSTFNLLEVAAVDEPKLHLWETGIMRITRHPQMVGQFLWCAAHTLWLGNSFMVAATTGLMAHHLFGVWHGDRRLKDKYGEAFDAVAARTSIIPFKAIWEGRQVLPRDYYKEFLRAPYLTITLVTLAAYVAHPGMVQGLMDAVHQ